jgi:DNA anti-recombination protein RmuC
MAPSIRVDEMEIWVSGVAAAAVLAGLALTVYALARLGSVLRNAEQQRQVRDGSDSVLLEAKLRELAAAQNEIAGRFSQAIESQAKSQGELQRSVAERLEALDKRLGENLKDTAAKTAET